MSAKQTLLDYVAGLTEEQALRKLPLMTDDGPAPALTSQQMAEIRAAFAQLDRGEGIPHDEVMRRWGVA